MTDDPELRRLLWYLLGGTRGAENRAKIIRAIKERPRNLNQLATDLGFRYHLVQHHIGVLKRNALVVAVGDHYGMTYFLTPWLDAHFELFEAVARELNV